MNITLRIELPPSGNSDKRAKPRVEILRVDLADSSPERSGESPTARKPSPLGGCRFLGEAFRKDRRQRILNVLRAAPGSRTNDRVLHAALKDLGHVVPLHVLHSDLWHLHETGEVCLHASPVDGTLFISMLPAA